MVFYLNNAVFPLELAGILDAKHIALQKHALAQLL